MKFKWKLLPVILMSLLVLLTSIAPAVAKTEKADGTVNQSVLKALGIDAPKRALVNNEITIQVVERGAQKPVSGASIWAISPDRTSEFQSAISEMDAANAVTAEEPDYGAMCNLYGEFIGKTGDHGELLHTFDETGRYLLIATKNHYYPGFSRINVYEKPKALGIRAPRAALVNTDVTMTIFDRFTTNPVQEAGVWAFSRENAETLKSELSNIRSEINISVTNYDYESLMNVYGEFLGRTNDEGQLTHEFDETGEYILVTWKPDYQPGFARITIKEKRSALATRAPKVAFVNREITMTVYERPGSIATDLAHIAVEGAGIWALSTNNAEELKKEIEEVKAVNETSAIEHDYEALMNIYGEFLGRTDENGQLKHAFDQAGNYVLVTWKQGYWPGCTRLTVRELPKALGIESPRVAPINEDVAMKVFQRGTHDPVGKADMWAFSLDQTDELRNTLSGTKSGKTVDIDYEAIASNAGGLYLGQTNPNGVLTHAFSDSGKYLLLSFKDGYWPGFSIIKITELQSVEPSAINKIE